MTPSQPHESERRAMPDECPAPCKTPDDCREEGGCLLGYGVEVTGCDHVWMLGDDRCTRCGASWIAINGPLDASL